MFIYLLSFAMEIKCYQCFSTGVHLVLIFLLFVFRNKCFVRQQIPSQKSISFYLKFRTLSETQNKISANTKIYDEILWFLIISKARVFSG